jgi:hypothetical protein
MKAVLMRLMNATFIVLSLILVVELKTFEPNTASSAISDFKQVNSKPDDFLANIKKANSEVIKSKKNSLKYSRMYNQLVVVLQSGNRSPQDLNRIHQIISANQAEFQLLLDQH